MKTIYISLRNRRFNKFKQSSANSSPTKIIAKVNKQIEKSASTKSSKTSSPASSKPASPIKISPSKSAYFGKKVAAALIRI